MLETGRAKGWGWAALESNSKAGAEQQKGEMRKEAIHRQTECLCEKPLGPLERDTHANEERG